MDPHPSHGWVPSTPTGRTPLRLVEAGTRDAPEELRSWSRSSAAHEYAMGALASGALCRFSTGDRTAYVHLSARLVTAALVPEWPAPTRQFAAA